MKRHEQYMHRCLALALKGKGLVSPNPMVGAVLVYDGRIIGEGYHEKFGEAHAEVNCINSVVEKELIPLSTLYVSLEPCSHFGKTPPCANFIIENNIQKVVVACTDFSSKVNGAGIELLQKNGIEVTLGVLQNEAIELNKRFFYFQEKKLPYVILKWAQSADGFIALKGEQVRLSGSVSNTMVHQWRSEEDAIWVGYNTALVDNPTLNVRHVAGKNPTRILFDKDLKLPDSFNILDNKIQTIVFNTKKSEIIGLTTYIQIESEKYILSILEKLAERNISSVIIEGGTKLIQEIIESNCWNEARIIQTPVLLHNGVEAPILKNHQFQQSLQIEQDSIQFFKNTKI